ncbi:MAG: prepilin-type N-terminal cleavage/methylation domain-containing protein [Parcubacteria group bacterium]
MKGFTIIEILVALAILGLVIVVTTSSFSRLNSSQALEKSASLITSTLSQARSISLSSKDNSQYGVHFSLTELVIFKGDDYVPLASDNIRVALNPAVEIREVALSGGGSNVIFWRLSGKAASSGTVTVSLVSDPSLTKTISIYETGLSEIN